MQHKLCECGCGQETPLASQTNRSRGYVKGEPIRFINGHNRRKSPVEYVVDQETGCWIWQRGAAAKLSMAKARFIRAVVLAPIKPSRRALAAEFGVTVAAIQAVLEGRSWKEAS